MDRRDELILLTKDLVRFRSTCNNAQERLRCLDYIENFFEGTNLVIKRHEREGIASTFISKGTKRPKILLYAHYDVVEGNDEQFEPHQKDGKLIGRGVFDMKCGLAVFMNIMKDLAETEHDVGLIVVGDEEQGGPHGAALMSELGYAGDIIMMPDGGMKIEQIIQKEKGVMRVLLEAKGKAVHSALNWTGESALRKLMAAIHSIDALVPRKEDHPEDHWVNTFTVGKLESGTMANQVPDTATALCDFRLVEGTDSDAFFEKIQEVIGDNATATFLVGCSAVDMGTQNGEVATYKEVLQKHGLTPSLQVAYGSSDARYFTKHGAIIIMGQPDGGGHHGIHEWVSIESISKYDAIVREYIDTVA